MCGNACTGGKVCVNNKCSCGTNPGTLSAIQTTIFSPTCATANCHAPTTVGKNTISPQAGLDLTSGKSFGNLVGVSSSECGARPRVAPGDVAGSYLMDKLLGTNLCTGSQMPKKGVSLAPAELDLVRSWICSGAANN
jgi:hypothetical protein